MEATAREKQRGVLTAALESCAVEMREFAEEWPYCGDVAEWVVNLLRERGFNDAWRPETNGHCFALVSDDSLIVDLWETDGTLKVKVFTAEEVATDLDYFWIEPTA